MALRTTLNKGLIHLLVITLSGLLSLPASLMINVPGASAATITVANTNDAGAGSLRQAIIDSNASAGVLDTINFNAALSGTITLASNLEVILDPVIIDGSTANDALGGADIILNAVGLSYCIQFNGGAGNVLKGIGCTGAANGLIVGPNVTGMTVGGTGARDINEWNNCTGAGIQIDGGDNVTLLQNQIGLGGGNGGSGLDIKNSATGIIVGGTLASQRNIIVNSTVNGINLVSTSVTISGNWIGTGTGANDLGNAQNGMFVGSGVTGTIGGLDAGAGNIISGNNQNGISISQSDGIAVKNNFIGTTSAGTAALANSQNGILISSQNNVIGGTGGGNVISGNTLDGIRLDGSVTSANGNTIQLNKIGLDKNGTAAIANGQAGIKIDGDVLNTVIGGTSLGNTISGNTGSGININTVGSTGTTIYGNTIGLQTDNTTALGNAQAGILVKGDSTIIGDATLNARRNIIASNGGLGIYINGADSVSIKNNYIGVAADGVTQRTNTNHAITLDSTAALNLIGDTIVGGPNLIFAANLKNCVNINTTAGVGNTVRQNNCLAGGNISLTAPANESIATPTVTTANTSYASGTSIANGTVDLFQNGTFFASATANGAGEWEKNALFNLNQKLSASVTAVINSTTNTSSTTAGDTISQDASAPAAPLVTSHTNNQWVNTTTITLSGTKEAQTSIWIDGVQQVANDALTTWTVNNFALGEGGNAPSGVAKDYSLNASTATIISINRDTIVPALPILSYASTSLSPATITCSGTEANASVYVSAVDTGINVDGLGNCSFNVDLVLGTNSISVTIVDNAGNTSIAGVATITGTSGGAGTAGSSSGTNSNSNSGDTTVGATEEDAPQSLAGEEETPTEEVVTPEEQTPEVVTPEVVTPEVVTPELVTPTETQSPETETYTKPKTFYSGIIEFIEPIKIPSLRDNLPEKPVKPLKFHPFLSKGNFFGPKNEYGIPEILIKIKLNGIDPGPERDTDGDGLLDYEELIYGGDVNEKDLDGDGRTDFEEVWLDGTDPESSDTDKDGISDPSDINPLVYDAPDLDSPELATYVEESGVTDPGLVDTDQDGISDQGEVILGSDPQDPDTDSDGLSDGDEVYSYGTDLTVTTSVADAGVLRVVNTSEETTTESGAQFLLGHALANETVTAWEVNEDGSTTQVGQSVTDEDGRFAIYTDELSEDTHVLVVTSGGDEIKQISSTFTINTINFIGKPQYVDLGITDGSVITDRTPLLSLKSTDAYQIMATFQSTIYSQTLIADAANQTVNFQPVENLELGEHTITWYAVDLETNQKSAPTQVNFTVATTAFATGDTNSPWLIVLGSVAVLASLTALALFFRSRRMKA